MANHGGFGVAVQIREELFQQLLTAAHRAGDLPRQLETTTPTFGDVDGNGLASISFDLWIDAPTAHFSQQEGVTLDIRAVGSVVINAGSVDPNPRTCRLTMTLACTATPELVQNPEAPDPMPVWPDEWEESFEVIVTLQATAPTASALVVLSGNPFPQPWIDFFSSPLFAAGVGMALNDEFSTPIRQMFPDRFIAFAEALRIGHGTTAVGEQVTGDGLLTFGFNLDNDAYNLHITGDATQVEDFMGPEDVAMILDAQVAPLLARYMRRQVNGSTSSVEVTSLNISFQDGHLHVSGYGEADFGDADFSMDVVPTIGRPETVEYVDDEYGAQYGYYSPPTDEVWIDLQGVSVDTEPYWWVVTIGVVVAAAAAAVAVVAPYSLFIFAPLAGAIGNVITSAVAAIPVRLVKHGQPTILSSHQVFNFPPGASSAFDFKLKQLRVFSDRLQSRVRLRPTGAGRMEGPSWIPLEALHTVQNFTLTQDWLAWDPEDPEAKIRWQVRRMDSNATVLTDTRWISANNARKLQVNFGALSPTTSHFSVTARVFRSSGQQSFDYFNATHEVKVNDLLDRNHPYVRWDYTVVALRLGHMLIHRRSELHRTAWPGRCRFADRFSKHVKELDYRDELPFATQDLASHSGEVCEYCFYGGPDKNQLIFDPASP